MPISDYIRNIRTKIGNDVLLMPGVGAIVINEQGEVLLHRRSDNGEWALPGGAMEPGEEPADAIVREVFEETGVTVYPERITGVYGNRNVQYPNGDRLAIVSITFLCRPISGEPCVNDDESFEVRYFDPNDLPENMDSYHRERIKHYQRGDSKTLFRFEGKI